MSKHTEFKRITTNSLQLMKANGEKFSMLTAYDYSFAKIFDQAGLEVILVGDSAGNVMAGHETTLPITLEQMIYHTQSVVRGAKRALIVADLPFGTYQSNGEVALASSIRMMKEGGAHALKLEGGLEVCNSVKRIVEAGIPVMGHLGLTPQSIYKFGTYNVRAKEEAEAEKLKSDALALQEAGVFAIVLEKIPSKLAKEVTESLQVPTIGIGAGNSCDGQVLVMHDMLGLYNEFNPRFVRKYMNLFEPVTQAIQQYINDIKSGDFPNKEESY
ncbi:3-methyl-2-oxobutanoate hydroxymethyltransferase [Haoranjiania flava]|uniref:3-methyl-2-oxobutanoate hydroxymethyltransferase n=1 Tax=Haoranjiania flava TaxID=1856322 RepID=A0AAE3IIX9_9BACT|nr:3-methyl-2-oxobutanoate hydroxymethyltransferase [Haoranjiania flava]MCU7692932.1 3-methyl-2-oxobutanoate hydroxymethyltransferase [Haoranjiania flava]